MPRPVKEIVREIFNDSPVLLRFTTGVASGDAIYDPGIAYRVPGKQAHEFIRAGYAMEIPEGLREQAEFEIDLRSA